MTGLPSLLGALGLVGILFGVLNLLVGLFKDEKKNDYLMVVNCDAANKRKATLSKEPTVSSIKKMDKKTGKWAALKVGSSDGRIVTSLELAPGNGELFKIKRNRKK